MRFYCCLDDRKYFKGRMGRRKQETEEVLHKGESTLSFFVP